MRISLGRVLEEKLRPHASRHGIHEENYQELLLILVAELDTFRNQSQRPITVPIYQVDSHQTSSASIDNDAQPISISDSFVNNLAASLMDS